MSSLGARLDLAAARVSVSSTTPPVIVGYRHTRSCLCGCNRVVDLVGRLVEDSDTPKLASLGLGYYAFAVPAVRDGRGALTMQVVCFDRVEICDACECPVAPWAWTPEHGGGAGACTCDTPLPYVTVHQSALYMFVNTKENAVPTASPSKSVATIVAAEVASLAGTQLSLSDLRGKVVAVMIASPDVAIVRFTPSGKKGAGFLEALDPADHVLAKIHVKATGEVEVKLDNQAPDAPKPLPDPKTDAELAAQIPERLAAAADAAADDRADAALEVAERGDATDDAPTSTTVRSILLALPGVREKTVDAILADYPPAVPDATPTLEQINRSHAPKKGLTGKALALWVLTGEGVVGQIAAERAKSPVKAADAKPKAPRSPRASKAATSAPSAAKAGASSRAKYPEEITDAVRRAKAARGTTAGAPGAKQHVLTRKVVADGDVPLGPPAAKGAAAPAQLVDEHGSVAVDAVTIDRILLAAGGVSAKRLRDIASGAAPKDQVKILQSLGKAIPDPFCSGRNLASMLVAWCEQIGARAAK